MSQRGNDLVKLAELIKLSAETAKIFSDTTKAGNGKVSRITQLAQQIEAAANELREIGKSFDSLPTDEPEGLPRH